MRWRDFRRRNLRRRGHEAQKGIEMTDTPQQVKAVSLLLGWSRSNLAGHVGVSDPTVAGYKQDKRKLACAQSFRCADRL
jgi:hypothetical protein